MENYRKPKSIEVQKAKEILRKRNLGLLLMLFALPTIGAIHTLTGSNAFSIIIAMIFMALIMVLLISASFSRCPRCGNNFFTKGIISNGFALKCVHCGLKGKYKN